VPAKKVFTNVVLNEATVVILDNLCSYFLQKGSELKEKQPCGRSSYNVEHKRLSLDYELKAKRLN
jgi:hypothetical protein